jgi:hypothetical protein
VIGVPSGEADAVQTMQKLREFLGISVQDQMLRGLAMGTTSHGQGTARILQETEEAGAFSAVAMGLTALAMAMLLPAVSRLIARLPGRSRARRGVCVLAPGPLP